VLHAVCSIEAGTKTEWQAALLAYSWRQAGIPDPLTVLCAGGQPSMDIGAEVVVTGNARHVDGGNYPPWNKPYSLWDWYDAGGPREQTVLLLDADMVVFGRLPEVQVGPFAPTGELYPSIPASLRDPLVRQLTVHPGLLQAVGVPLWIDRATLGDLVPQWVKQLGTLRALGLPHDRWVAEMIGYSLAASDLGLYHNEIMVSCGPTLFHYFIGHCGLQWDKGSYTPWEPLPPVNPDAPDVVKAFGRLLDEYAALRRGEP
jgi:hypothetical protein